MTSHVSRPAYGTDFLHNFERILDQFLGQFLAKDGGGVWVSLRTFNYIHFAHVDGANLLEYAQENTFIRLSTYALAHAGMSWK